MNPEKPQTPPEMDELLEKARQEADVKKPLEVGAEPSSMDDLLKSLQKEVSDQKIAPVAEVVTASAPEIDKSVKNEAVSAESEDPVKAELEKRQSEFKDKYREGRKKFENAWTSTPEFQALDQEHFDFIYSLKSRGFTLEAGVIKPIDKERIEREEKIEEIKESSRQSRVNSEIETGKNAYAILSGNTEAYKKSVEAELQSMIAMEQNGLESMTLGIANMSDDDFQRQYNFNTNSNTREGILASAKNYREGRVKVLQELLAKTSDPKELEDMMKRDRENLNSGQGVWVKGQGGGFAVSEHGRKIENSDGLIRGLTERVDNVFDDRKKEGGINRALDFGDYPMESTRVLKGVGFAALEAGDVKTAAQAFAFSERIDPLSPEQMQEMVAAIGKLPPEKKQEFVIAMDSEKRKPYREYKKEVETRSKDKIMSR